LTSQSIDAGGPFWTRIFWGEPTDEERDMAGLFVAQLLMNVNQIATATTLAICDKSKIREALQTLPSAQFVEVDTKQAGKLEQVLAEQRKADAEQAALRIQEQRKWEED
jgi:hypothetical protein